uniref:Uncharacterized protein n=1 Tax=Trichogramma kaykai TaxID=54128 RepID=A0ABD2WLT0_9HYME
MIMTTTTTTTRTKRSPSRKGCTTRPLPLLYIYTGLFIIRAFTYEAHAKRSVPRASREADAESEQPVLQLLQPVHI